MDTRSHRRPYLFPAISPKTKLAIRIGSGISLFFHLNAFLFQPTLKLLQPLRLRDKSFLISGGEPQTFPLGGAHGVIGQQLDLTAVTEGTPQLPQCLGVVLFKVDSLNQNTPQDRLSTQTINFTEILEDWLQGDTGIFLMACGIGVLDIKEKQIGTVNQPLAVVP